MDIGWVLILIIFHFHLGWCWVCVLERINPDYVWSPLKHTAALLLWPFSLILVDAGMEDTHDHHD